jgi:hypothetical protein
VTTWKDSLARGLLPADDTEWPDETFRTALLETLKELDMARFTRKVFPSSFSLLLFLSLSVCVCMFVCTRVPTSSSSSLIHPMQHKPVTDTLLRNILEMLHEYEDEMADAPSEGCVRRL